MPFSGQKTFNTSHCWVSTTATPTAAQFVAIRNAFMSVTVDGFDRQVGNAFVAGQSYPVQGVGKRNAGTVTVKYLYAEGSTGAAGVADIVRTQHELTTPTLFVKWAVAGTATGDHFYTTCTADTLSSVVTHPGYPQGEVGPGDPVANEFTVATTLIWKSES